jgi:hypothetical protein
MDKKTIDFINNLPYWQAHELREMWKKEGKDAVMKYLDNLVMYNIVVKKISIDDIVGDSRKRFLSYYK